MNQDCLVFSAIGFVNPACMSTDEFMQHLAADEAAGFTLDEYRLAGFKPEKYLTNRRMMKNVAPYHGLGMAAIEFLKINAKWDAKSNDPYRVGLYVAAPPASVMDYMNHVEPLKRAREIDPVHVEKEFGLTAMDTLGTTLLTGLPNNVLCNGAIILGAKGKNDSYMMGETGSFYAIASAARNVRSGHIDIGFAGGFAQHSDPVTNGMNRQDQLIDGGNWQEPRRIKPYTGTNKTIFGDGAAFVAIETVASSKARGLDKPLAEFIGVKHVSFAQGPLAERGPDLAFDVAKQIRSGMSELGVEAEAVGLAFLSATGLDVNDLFELKVAEHIFHETSQKPALASLTKLTGNMMEASGVLEACAIEPIYSDAAVPQSIALGEAPIVERGFGSAVDPSKPYVMVIRSSMYADQISVMLLKRRS